MISEETRKKMSDAKKGKPCPWNKGKKWSEERKKKFSKLIKGKIRTKEHNIKIGIGQLGNKRGPTNKGNKYPSIQKENHYKWNGGTMRYWNLFVKERDGYICKKCGYGDKTIMEVHHEKPISIYPYLKKNIENLITLCPNCHRRETLNDKKFIKYSKNISNDVINGVNGYFEAMCT